MRFLTVKKEEKMESVKENRRSCPVPSEGADYEGAF